MRPGKQRATTAGELDETMTARHDFSPDNVEHSSSLAHRAMTPQYADALMCSHEHEQTVANTLLSSKQAGASGTSVMHANLAQPTSRACCLLQPSLLRCPATLWLRWSSSLRLPVPMTNILSCAGHIIEVCAALEAHLRPASPPGTVPVTLRRARLAICRVGRPVRCVPWASHQSGLRAQRSGHAMAQAHGLGSCVGGSCTSPANDNFPSTGRGRVIVLLKLSK